jgi:hypothetical protein
MHYERAWKRLYPPPSLARGAASITQGFPVHRRPASRTHRSGFSCDPRAFASASSAPAASRRSSPSAAAAPHAKSPAPSCSYAPLPTPPHRRNRHAPHRRAARLGRRHDSRHYSRLIVLDFRAINASRCRKRVTARTAPCPRFNSPSKPKFPRAIPSFHAKSRSRH